MKKTTFIIVLGILLRFLLSTITFHPDLSAIILAGKIILDGHWLNFYDSTTLNQIVFNYPPLAYLIPSLFYLPFNSFLSSLYLNLVNTSPAFFSLHPVYLPLLIFKLPMILADIAIIFLLPNLFVKPSLKRLSQVLWALNPIAIFVSSMMGQVDIILVVFLVISLIFIKRHHLNFAAIFIGLSILIKPAGLILLPLLFIKEFSRTKKIIYSLIPPLAGLAIYFIGIAPYLGSINFRHYALIADQTTKSTYAGIAIASGTQVPWFFITYLLIIYLYYSRRVSFINAFGASLLSSLAFTHFHPQWILWITPSLIYQSLKTKKLFIYFSILLCWFVVLLSFDTSLHLGMFLPLNFVNGLNLNIFTTLPTLLPIVLLSRAAFIALLILSLI